MKALRFLVVFLSGIAALCFSAEAAVPSQNLRMVCAKVEGGANGPKTNVSIYDWTMGGLVEYELLRATKICKASPIPGEGAASLPAQVCYKARPVKSQKKPVVSVGTTTVSKRGKEVCLMSLEAPVVAAPAVTDECEPCAPCLCGNGTQDVGEDCDDANNIAGDGCSPVCRFEFCGSGFLDPGEECDAPDDRRCPGACNFECACGTSSSFFGNANVIMTLEANGVSEEVVLFANAQFDLDFGAFGDADGDGFEEVPFRVNYWNAQGSGLEFGTIFAYLRSEEAAPFAASRGVIEEEANANSGVLDLPPLSSGGMAMGSLGLYLEVNLPDFGLSSSVFHNTSPLGLTALLTNEPPAPGEAYSAVGSTPLFDESGRATPLVITSFRFIPSPLECGNGLLDFGETCDPSIPRGFLCENDSGQVGVCTAACTCSVL